MEEKEGAKKQAEIEPQAMFEQQRRNEKIRKELQSKFQEPNFYDLEMVKEVEKLFKEHGRDLNETPADPSYLRLWSIIMFVLCRFIQLTLESTIQQNNGNQFTTETAPFLPAFQNKHPLVFNAAVCADSYNFNKIHDFSRELLRDARKFRDSYLEACSQLNDLRDHYELMPLLFVDLGQMIADDFMTQLTNVPTGISSSEMETTETESTLTESEDSDFEDKNRKAKKPQPKKAQPKRQ
jgi:hypothetical protein